MVKIIKIHHEWLSQDIALAFIHNYPYLGLNTSQIKCCLKHLKSISQEDNVHEINLFQQETQKTLKILWIFFHMFHLIHQCSTYYSTCEIRKNVKFFFLMMAIK